MFSALSFIIPFVILSAGCYRLRVKLKAFNEIQSMCDKHLKGNKDAGRISPI